MEPTGPSIMEDEVSAANAAKQRQQQRAETIRCYFFPFVSCLTLPVSSCLYCLSGLKSSHLRYLDGFQNLLRRAEESNAVRTEPLGQDRRYNRYWRLAAGSEAGSGRIFVELQVCMHCKPIASASV